MARCLFKEETKSDKGEEGAEDEVKEIGMDGEVKETQPDATFHSATKTQEEEDPAAKTGQSKVTFSKGGGGISEE